MRTMDIKRLSSTTVKSAATVNTISSKGSNPVGHTSLTLPATPSSRLYEFDFENTIRQPWRETSKEDMKWHPYRIAIAKVVYSKTCDHVMMAIIIFNLAIIIKETDEEAKCYPVYKDDLRICTTSAAGGNMPVLNHINLILLIIYTVEALLRLYVERWKFFSYGENLLDATVCIVGWVERGLESFFSLSWFRILRVFRLFRATRIVTSVPELRALFVGFIGSMRAMFFGSCLLIGILLLCSILLVQYIHPVCASIDFGSCKRCSMGYMSVVESMLTLFQTIIAGDSWGQINMEVIQDSPWPGILLPFMTLLVGVGIMNLILAVIVDRAVAAREDNKHHQAIEKLTQQRARRERLFRMFNELDTDRSGYLESVEMKEAFETNEDLRHLMLMADIDEEEIQSIFEWIDGNGDGAISYKEFCDILEEIQAADVRKTCVITKLMVERLARRFDARFDAYEDSMRHQSQLLASIDTKINGHVAKSAFAYSTCPTKYTSSDQTGHDHVSAKLGELNRVISTYVSQLLAVASENPKKRVVRRNGHRTSNTDADAEQQKLSSGDDFHMDDFIPKERIPYCPVRDGKELVLPVPLLPLASIDMAPKAKMQMEEDQDIASFGEWLQSADTKFDGDDPYAPLCVASNTKHEDKFSIMEMNEPQPSGIKEQKSLASASLVAYRNESSPNAQGACAQARRDYFLAQLGKKLKGLQQARLDQQSQIMKDFQRTLRDDAVLASHEIMTSIQRLLPSLKMDASVLDNASAVDNADINIQEKKLQSRPRSSKKLANPFKTTGEVAVAATRWVAYRHPRSLDRNDVPVKGLS